MAKSEGFFHELSKHRIKFLMLTPAIFYFVIFAYLPMVGLIIAFKNFTYSGGIFSSPWVGLANFKFFFVTGQALNVTKNTILYNLAFITVNNTLQILCAILITELAGKYFKKISQSVMFLPYFISWVVVGAFIYNIFNYEFGALNTFLKMVHMHPVNVYTNPSIWKYILVSVSAWKWVGYGTVLYLAAIVSIDSQIYEAAEIDGANIFQRIRYITLPSLVPTMIILVLLAVGNIMRGDFQMFYQVVGNNGLVLNATDVIDTFVVRSLMDMQEFGMAAAVGFYQSVLGFFIIMSVNFIIKKKNSDYSLF
jgi:putative aldouronate transport system permease protein